MPTVPKTSQAEIMRASLSLLDQHGLQGLTFVALAEKLGIRAPSLYKRFKDREDLIDAVELEVIAQLGDALRAVPVDPRAQCEAYLAYARTYPARYKLLFGRAATATDVSMKARAAALAPVLESLALHFNPAQALTRARVLTAFMHGYITMESTGAFRMGGDFSDALREGLDLLLPSL